jgi:hypothetical protein
MGIGRAPKVPAADTGEVETALRLGRQADLDRARPEIDTQDRARTSTGATLAD